LSQEFRGGEGAVLKRKGERREQESDGDVPIKSVAAFHDAIVKQSGSVGYNEIIPRNCFVVVGKERMM
jgi:hypothetical protein